MANRFFYLLNGSSLDQYNIYEITKKLERPRNYESRVFIIETKLKWLMWEPPFDGIRAGAQ